MLGFISQASSQALKTTTVDTGLISLPQMGTLWRTSRQNHRIGQTNSDAPLAEIGLSTLDGKNGFELIGEVVDHGLGKTVSNAGDMNGDGIADVIIGASDAALNDFNSGKSYLVFGSQSDFEASLSLSSLDGVNGFALVGEADGDNSGRSVSGIGDMNGDGIDDVIIGAPGADPNGFNSGKSYVVFGSRFGFESIFFLSSLDGNNGFVLLGEAIYDYSGWSVSGAGDVNGDGIADVIIGARGAEADVGRSYVVFGNMCGFGRSIALSSLDGNNGFALLGEPEPEGEKSGWSVSGAGDVNGDGIADVIIGAPYVNNLDANNSGKSYVVFGSRSSFEASFALSNLDGNNGFVLLGEVGSDMSGFSVSGTDDVNGDGIGDVVIGAPYAQVNGVPYVGKSYVVFGSASGFGAALPLSSLNGANGFMLPGESEDESGWSVSGAGDVNGDGIADVIIGAPYATSNGILYVGKSYVVFGSTSGFGPSLALSSLNGKNGFVLTGKSAADRLGYSVSGAGDVNGDQIDDVIIWAPNDQYSGSRLTDSYIVFGELIQAPPSNSLLTEIGLSSLDGENGFEVTGESPGDRSGYSVSGAGDVNGDGIADMIVGAPSADLNGVPSGGKSYVVFGDTSGFDASITLLNLNGNNGFMVVGGINDHSGNSVSSAGDVNGDGIDDLIIGGPNADPDDSKAKSYVIFGSASGFDASVSLSNLNGSNGFILLGESRGDRLGYSVSNAGDVNGDEIDDVIIGAPNAEPNGSDSGKVYVVFGSVSGFDASLNLSSLNGSNGFVLVGELADDHSGWSVSGAGDVNGDGVNDVIVGAPYSSPNGSNSGKSYVVFGSRSNFNASVPLSGLDGSNGFVLVGESMDDRSGWSVSGAGDMNGDGIADVIIGAPNAEPNGSDSGKVYVVFGSVSGFDASLNLSSLNGSNGFVLVGEMADDHSGWSVSDAGDMNRDGIDDLVIGAPDADGDGSKSGKIYVVFGKNVTSFEQTFVLSSLYGSNNGFVLMGESVGDRSGESVSSVGDMNGDGIDDIVIGAPDFDLSDSPSGKSYVVFGELIQTPSSSSSWSLFEVRLPVLVGGAVLGAALIGAIAKFGIWDKRISSKPVDTPLLEEAKSEPKPVWPR